MDAITFHNLFDETIKMSSDVLIQKAGEYADDTDRLRNFKKAAALEEIDPISALGGMMVKHTVSVYDFIISGKNYPLEKWDEKIIDHINYLILLRALVVEAMDKGITGA